MMNQEAAQVIEAILKRGNDAEIRRKGSGYIILEVKKTTRYEATEKRSRPQPRDGTVGGG